MFTIPNNDWKEIFLMNTDELNSIETEINILNEKYSPLKIYPKKEDIFRAFELCTMKNLKVIIIGQDCYHGTEQANGLCFSVNESINNPPSLKNILKEMKNDLNIQNL